MFRSENWKFAIGAAVIAVASLATQTQATSTYTYEFTLADILNNQFVSGANGTTAADNGLFDGARLLRVGSNANHQNAARTFVASQHDTFNQRWNDLVAEGATFTGFNLWGLDGRGVNWGEDFKPFEWVSVTAPTGWSTGFYEWPASWGTPPAGAHTLLFPWFAPNDGVPLNLTQEELEAIRFTVTIAFEDGDEFWGNNTNGAPNDIGSALTIWFGGWIYSPSGDVEHIYEGNLLANVVPLPAVACAGLTLLGGIGGSRIIRRRNA